MGDLMGLSALDVVFAEATPEQRKISWELNAACWASPLTVNDYVAREQLLSTHELSRDGHCRYWVLYQKDKPIKIVASCESYRKDILVSENGTSREGVGYSIAKVYTNPNYRRQGMAALLMHRLQEHLDYDSDCSVLYSDIGKGFYTSLGWAIYPSQQVTLYRPTTRSSRGTLRAPFEHSQPQRIRYIESEELRGLCLLDETQLTRRFNQFPTDGRTHVAFLPTFAQMSWHLVQVDFMAEKLQGMTPSNKGVVTDDGGSWACWKHDWNDKTLKVLRIAHMNETTVEQRVDNIKVLLEAALVEASRWQLPNVVIWNPNEEMTPGSKAVGNAHPENVMVIFSERMDTRLPGFRWAGGKDARLTVWEDNYAYSWC